MKKKKEGKTKLIRVDTDVANRVEAFILPKRQSLCGFFSIAAEEKLKLELQKEKK